MSLSAKRTHRNRTTENSNSRQRSVAKKAPFFSPAKSFFRPILQPQPKLTVNAPNDIYEKEADAVADQVMRMPAPQVRRQPEEEEEMFQMKEQIPGIQRKCKVCEAEESLQKKSIKEEEELQTKRAPSYIQRKCKECEQEEKMQLKSASQLQSDRQNEVSPAITTQLSASKGRGVRLPKDIRLEMSHKMGSDFSGVKVHTDSTAIQMNRDLGAKAFTHGKDIYFNQGQFKPASFEGKHLLAHELTHVVQQHGNSLSFPSIQRAIEGTFRVEWRNKIDSEVKDQGNSYATAIVAGISAASMPSKYDDSVKTFLENLQKNLGKYTLGKVLDNVPGGGVINAAVNAMIDTRSQIEATTIREAYEDFKNKTRDVLLAGVDSMMSSEGQFNQRVQDLIMARADSDPRFNNPPSETEDANRYSERMQVYIQRSVSQQMFGNPNADFSQMIADVNNFMQRSFQYFILARAEVMAAYRQCMARQATEGSTCDQGYWSWERYPRECRHQQCEQWLTYSPMPHDWSGPRPRQEHLGMCAGQPCSWFTISTGVEHPAGYASVRETEYRRQRTRYQRE